MVLFRFVVFSCLLCLRCALFVHVFRVWFRVGFLFFVVLFVDGFALVVSGGC